MKGAPRTYATWHDIAVGLNDYPDETKEFVQRLLDDRYCIVSCEELPEGLEGRDEPPLYRSYVAEESDGEGNVLKRHVFQQVWKEDDNAALFRLDLTVAETEALIAGTP